MAEHEGPVSRFIETRRAALAKIARAGFKLAGGALVLKTAASTLLHSSKRPSIEIPPDQDIYPGWIGADQSQFFDSEGGPEKFMRVASMDNEIMRSITTGIFQGFEQAYRGVRRFRLDEIYALSLDQADRVFDKLDPNRISDKVNPKIEKTVAATVALAFAVTGWTTKDDLRKLGAFKDIPPGMEVSTYFWKGENSVARTIFPAIMPDTAKKDGPDEEPGWGGEDRVRHFTMFTALHQLVLSSLQQKIGLEQSSPRVLKMTSKFMAYKRGIKSEALKAAIFTEIAGVLYEAKSTFRFVNLPLPGQNRDGIKSGLFDPNVGKDLLTNAKAIHFSNLLRRSVEVGLYLGDLLTSLSDPNLGRFTNRTIMDGMIPGLKLQKLATIQQVSVKEKQLKPPLKPAA